MMKKRKSPIPQGDDSDNSEAMILVEAEEKVEAVEEDDDSDDDDDDDDNDNDDDSDVEMNDPEERSGNSSPKEDNSFMDTFYGLSSSNPTERAQAANAMLHHCLLGPDANTKDATYALKRLLNGLCSGRAASRQGNASALASFLKIALEEGQLKEIKTSQQATLEEQNESILEYVRRRLLKATDPSQTQGRKKGSEERDYQFGRLFGILGVVRSGILLPGGDHDDDKDLDQIMTVVTGFVSDLVELYWHKKWMREPAAHAIGTILNTYYDLVEEGGTDAKKIVQHLVDEVVIPQLLQDEAGSISLESYSAEQIAVAATIQSKAFKELPAPLDKPVISVETIPVIAKTLEETSTVAQPRMHLVWDSIWIFLSEPVPLEEKETSGPPQLGIRKVRKEPLLGGDSTQDIVQSLVRTVVVEGLLRVDIAEGTAGKTTHEKRALAMSIVRNLMSVPFNSSITGATQLQLDAEEIAYTMTPVIIQRLFLDVICAGSGGKKKAHTLKPLALQSLELMIDSMSQDTSEAGMRRRVATAQHMVKCEPRFDALTKTTTIADLVGLSEAAAASFGTAQSAALTTYFDFLEEQIECAERPADALSYIDLLYQSTKRLLRLETEDSESKISEELEEFRPKAIERILGFFMATSFFDCSNVSSEKATPKKSKKGKKKSTGAAAKHASVEAAFRCNQREKGTLSYDARSILSERFYSLLAEYINASLHAGAGSVAKDSAMLDIVANICDGWKQIELAGAKPLFPAIDAQVGDNDESESPHKIVSQLQGLAKDLTSSSKDLDDVAKKARKRCAVGCAALASTLFLHLLGCGKPENIMEEEDVTTEDDDDSADIIEAIEEIGELAPNLLDSSSESKQNPLAAFADVCMSLFSSGVSSGSPGRGASPRLLREAIKFAWIGVLSASATADQDLLDSDVVNVLLNGIGAGQNLMEEDHDEENDDDEDDDSDEEMDSDDGEFGDFSKVGNILGASDDDEDDKSDDDENKSEPQTAEDEQDVEINSDRLNDLLEDDSDAGIDVGELEHHEGADAALAMLIKMKQDARKASRKARERLELEKQVRCTLLLETLLGKSESWASLLRSDIILQMALPLLTYRNKIEKSLANATGKSGQADASMKKAMLDRLTAILKTKLFKLKFASMQTTESVDLVEYCASLATDLFDMARKNISKDQRACCSVGLVTTVKALAGSEGALQVASVYGSAVEEWSTKGTSRLEISLFEDLIHHCPRYAFLTSSI